MNARLLIRCAGVIWMGLGIAASACERSAPAGALQTTTV